MNPATVAQLANDLLGYGVGFTVSPNKDLVGDWVVTATPPGGTVDAKSIVTLETKYGISSPITSVVTFL